MKQLVHFTKCKDSTVFIKEFFTTVKLIFEKMNQHNMSLCKVEQLPEGIGPKNEALTQAASKNNSLVNSFVKMLSWQKKTCNT